MIRTLTKKFLPVFAVLLALCLLASCSLPFGWGKKKEAEAYPFEGLDFGEYIQLGEYKGLAVAFKPKEISNADVLNEAKQYFLESGIPLGIKADSAKTVVAKGDNIEFDFEGDAQGVSEDTLAGMAAKGHVMPNVGVPVNDKGDMQFIPGFEEQIIGQPINKDFDVKVTFPEDYHSIELAGKEAVFKCKVHKIGSTTLTDEGVVNLTGGQLNSVNELLDYIKEQMPAQIEFENRQLAIDCAIDNAKFIKLPEEAEKAYQKPIDEYLEGMGITLDEYLDSYGGGQSADEFMEENVTMPARQDLFVFAVAAKEGLEVTDADTKELLDSIRQGDDSMTDEFIYENYGDKASMVRYLMLEKVKEFIYDNAVDDPNGATHDYGDPHAGHNH